MIQNLIESTTLVSEIYLGWLWQTMLERGNVSTRILPYCHCSGCTSPFTQTSIVTWEQSYGVLIAVKILCGRICINSRCYISLICRDNDQKKFCRRCPVYTAFMWGRGEFSLQYENSFTWVMSKHWSLVHRFKKYISMWRKHLSLWFPGGFKIFPFYRYAGLSWWNMNISPSFFPPSASVPSQIPSHCTLEMVRCRRDCCSGSLYNCEDSWECTLHQYSTTHGGRTVLA